MTVAIDARPLADPAGEAFSYTLHLIHSLVYVAPAQRLHLFFDRQPAPEHLPRQGDVTASLLSAPRSLWKLAALPAAAERVGADVLHVQGLLPARSRMPVVTTVRHLGPVDQAGRYPASTARAWHYGLPRQLASAAAVLVPWRTVRDALVDRLDAPADRVHVTPYGAEPLFKPQCDTVQQVVLDRLALPARYILARVAPGASVTTAVATWRLAREQHGLRLPLVIDRPANQVPAEPDVIGLGPMSDIPPAQWPAVYSAAAATLLVGDGEPSALALLETLASGTPAVGPNDPLLAEAAPKLAVLGDQAEQAAGLARLAADGEWRTVLMRGGLARSRLFTWPSMAERTLEVYRQAAASAVQAAV